ncbi:fimbria/pilus outer membrane usher protein [soil metagenome]
MTAGARARQQFWRLFASICVLLACVSTARAAEPRFLEVVVNDRTTRFVAEVVERDGSLFAKASDFDDVGLVAPPKIPADGLVDLGKLPGITYRIDERTQLLYLRATNQAMRAQLLTASANTGGPATAAQTSAGLIVNYDLAALTVGGRHYGNGLVDVTAYGSSGILDNRVIIRAGDYQEQHLQRLESTYTGSDPAKTRRALVGDFVTGSLSWTRPIRLGGAQYTTDFSLRPDLITFPSTNLSGVAAVPSSVDVLVNGVSQFRQDIDQGPFVINRLPVTTGAGQVQVVLRDALGRESVETVPFYSSEQLLADGYDSFSVESGAVRKFYGLPDDRYTFAAAVGSWRHGLADSRTVEVHLETSDKLLLGGAGYTLALGTVGIASVSAAHSAFDGLNGNQWSTSFERSARDFSFSASLTRATQGYCDVACKAGDAVPRRIGRTSVGIPVAERMYIAVALTQLNAPGRANNIISGVPNFDGTTTVSRPAVDRASIASLSWTYSSYSGYSVLFTLLRDFEQSRSGAGFLSFSIPLDARRSTSVNVTRDRQGTAIDAQASQASIAQGEIGWRAQTSMGSLNRQFAEADYQARGGRVYAGVDRFGGQTATRAGVSGSIVTLDDSVYSTRTVSDAFAVVEVAGTPDVRIYQENRLIGRTGPDGKLLIPQLQSNRSNRIAIDPLDLSVDSFAPLTTQQIVPAERSGVLARFDVTRGNQAVVVFVDPEGKFLPVGSVIVQADGRVSPLGHDGQAYLLNLQKDNIVTIAYGQSRCTAQFGFDQHGDDLPTLGPVPCMPVAK